ncbi:hypothetical protein KW782_03075 [Candidatus Parcubacteria bacterium]|nr:hypothetical protein [Candidatus Parcubacteria bacterium]
MSDAILNDVELLEFWEAQVSPHITALINSSCRFPELQAHFNQNNELITARYNTSLRVFVRPPLSKDHSDGFPMGCRLEDGKPTIAIFPHALLSGLRKLIARKPTTAQKIFESEIHIGFLHETDHLALGLVGADDRYPRIKQEQLAWAETCEQTIRPLLVTHRREVSESTLIFYKAWIACGRKPKSNQWRDFISSKYGW